MGATFNIYCWCMEMMKEMKKKLNAKPIIADQSHIENEARSLAS